MLFRDSVKLPIRRDDLSKKILANYKKAAGLIIEEAAVRLQQIFGLTLTEVDGKKHVYILVSDFGPSDIEEFTSVKTDTQKTEYTILMSLLAMIEISNGKLDTEQALDGLRKLGFNNCEHKHKNGKDEWWIDIVKKDFMRQLYIEQFKEAGGQHYYSAGFRAKIEIGRLNVHQFISGCFGEKLDEIREQEIGNEVMEVEENNRREKEAASRRGSSQGASQTPPKRGRKKSTQGEDDSPPPSQQVTPTQKSTSKRGRTDSGSQAAPTARNNTNNNNNAGGRRGSRETIIVEEESQLPASQTKKRTKRG